MKAHVLALLLLISLALNAFAGYRYLTQEIYKAGYTAGAQYGQNQIGSAINGFLSEKGEVPFARFNEKGEKEEIILIPKK